MSVVDMISLNGDRHVKNALKHFADGLPERAEGSMKKALRNYEKAARAGALFAPEETIQKLAAWRLRMQVKRVQPCP